MRPLLSLLATAALLLGGCSSRERANPFDPLNPGTGGRPSGFTALAADREVRLRWDAVSGGTFIGYQLFRRAPGETSYQPLTDVLGTSVISFRDSPLLNGGDYAYRLYFVFRSGLGSLPGEDTAGPGPARPWLIESRRGDLIRSTPDNRHVLERRGGFGATADVAVNPRNGDVWVVDEEGGRVVVYQADAGVAVSVPSFQRPVAVAVDPSNTTGWVCDQGLVHHVRRTGQFEPIPIGPLDQPVDAAVDPFNGYVWICELGRNRVHLYDDAGQFLWTCPVSRPSRVAVDSLTHEGWVTSFEAGVVTRVSPAGVVLDTFSGFVAPLGVAVDSNRGLVWVADPYAGRVVALRRDGQTAFQVNRLTDAGELSVDAATGEAWVALGSPGSIARVSPTGTILRTQGGFVFPFAIAVDPGGR